MAPPTVSGITTLSNAVFSPPANFTVSENSTTRLQGSTISPYTNFTTYRWNVLTTNLTDYVLRMDFIVNTTRTFTDIGIQLVDTSARVRRWILIPGAVSIATTGYYDNLIDTGYDWDYQDTGFDLTSIAEVNWIFRGNISNVDFRPQYMVAIKEVLVSGGSTTELANNTSITTYLSDRSAETTLGRQIGIYESVKIGNNNATYFENGYGGIYFPVDTDKYRLSSDKRRAIVYTTNVNTIYAWQISSAAPGCKFIDQSSATNIYRGLVLQNYVSADFGNADIDGLFIDGTGAATGGDFVAGFFINSAASYAYNWDGVTDLKNCTFTGCNSAIRITGNVTLDNLTFINNDHDFFVDVGSGTVTITVDSASSTDHSGGFSNAGYVAAKVSSAGATVVIATPSPTLTLSGLVAGSRVYVRNTTDSVDLYNEIEATTEWSGSVPSSKALLIRVRNASGTPKYKTYQTTTAGISADQTIVVNQELDE